MDIDKALEVLREWAFCPGKDVEEAAEAFNALDEWLSDGGFLPGAWHR